MRNMVISNGDPCVHRPDSAPTVRTARTARPGLPWTRLRHGVIWGEDLQELADMRKTSTMRNHFVTDEAKKKLLRPCREARVLGL